MDSWPVSPGTEEAVPCEGMEPCTFRPFPGAAALCDGNETRLRAEMLRLDRTQVIAEGTGPRNTDSAAMAYFRAKLRFEIDVMDVADAPEGTFVLVDTRRQSSWEHGHIPGAVHLPTADIPSCAHELMPHGVSVVVYSWGPGCNGSTVAALAFAELGYPVREMIGGIEYWARNGLPVETVGGVAAGKPDGLVTAHPG
jgi:rhodanese-related sulfurtransferase